MDGDRRRSPYPDKIFSLIAGTENAYAEVGNYHEIWYKEAP